MFATSQSGRTLAVMRAPERKKQLKNIKNLLNQFEILINRFAQEKITLEEILTWFEKLNSENQSEVILNAKMCLIQSHPDEETIEKAIELIPLKQTATPIVIFKNKEFKIALDKTILLPENENRKVFITLISLFKVSDTKRRINICKNECSHEWHNLEDTV